LEQASAQALLWAAQALLWAAQASPSLERRREQGVKTAI
jgi:hypothetical protein